MLHHAYWFRLVRLRLTVLGELAEFERELIRARTGEGRARAVARGVKMGRKPKLTPHQVKEVLGRKADGGRRGRARNCAELQRPGSLRSMTCCAAR